MSSDLASKYTARTIESGKDLYFCDIGDLLVYLNKRKQPDIRAEVKDYPTGTWIDAAKAFFVQAPKRFNTPMGWSIAAFREKKDGSGYGNALDLAGAMKAVK
jgi:nitrous oxide reductase accessory protein NosL